MVMTDMINKNGWHYLYIVECESFIKVGITNDMNKRLETLSSSNPFKLSVIDCVQYENQIQAGMVEKMFHHKLKDIGKHVKYEWFINDSESMFLIDELKEQLNSSFIDSKYHQYKSLMCVRDIAYQQKNVTLQDVSKYLTDLNMPVASYSFMNLRFRLIEDRSDEFAFDFVHSKYNNVFSS